MTLLQHWEASGADFAEGVKLLSRHGGRQHLTAQAYQRLQRIALFQDNVDAYNLGKLRYALSQIPAPNELPDQATPQPVTITTSADPDPVGISVAVAYPQSAPPAVTSELAKHLHKKHAHHHAMMVAATTNEERATHAAEILSLNRLLDAEYDRLRQGPSATDALTDMPPPRAEQTTLRTMRKLASLRTRVSRLKNKLIPKASGKRLADLEKELQQKQAEIQAIESTLV